MKFPQIGEVLPNGHTVDAGYCIGADRYVLAHRDGAPEPYVVWNVDQDGDTWGGKYFTDQPRAQRCFAAMICDNFDNSTEKPIKQVIINVSANEAYNMLLNPQKLKETLHDLDLTTQDG